MRKGMSDIVRLRLVITVIFFTLTFLAPFIAIAQCSQLINAFPYHEDFENSNGNWVTGGTASDWAWGVPSKSVINSAGSGLKCWTIGGLSNKSYGNGENAWVKTPCFDFTNLKDPYLTFKVFWETEREYDGANLQYSIDNGATWQELGAANETGGCKGENWYNYSSLQNIYIHDAWSGNIQSSRPPCIVSGGSAGWVIAKHDVPEVAGKSNVIFRFVFVSGTSCNDFDGFAIDDFMITDAPSSIASFTYDCSSNLRVNFKSTSSLCPTSYLWNFDDPSSGSDNTSTEPNPTHAYTLEGNYRVSLTVFGPGNNSSTYTIPNLEIITNIKSSIVTPIRCNGDSTGIGTVGFSGDSSNIKYYWDSKPSQNTRTAVHLPEGKYNVTILNSEGCPASANIILTEPPPILYAVSTIKPNCTLNNGSIDINMLAGLSPYKFNWIPNVSNTSFAKKLASGNYILTVTDNNACNKIINIQLPDSGDLKAAILNHKDVGCFDGKDGMATVTVTGGNAPYVYAWTSGGNAVTETNLAAADYSATVTDGKGCKAFAYVTINQPEVLSSIIKVQNTSCGINNGNAKIEVYGGIAPYQLMWSSLNDTKDSVNNLAPGKYIVKVKDANGCSKNDTATIDSSTAVHLQLTHTDILCAGDSTGSAKAIVSGGVLPYSFQWTNGMKIFNQSFIANLAAGTYNCEVQDARKCVIKSSVVITQPEPLKVIFTAVPSYCDQLNGGANSSVSGGTPPYSFDWATLSNRGSALTNVHSGNYRLTLSDKNNCSVTSFVDIPNEKPPDISLGNDTTLCPGSAIILSPGIYKSYRWQDNSTHPNFTVTNEGTYFVEVMDERSCVLNDTIKITGDCGFIFFPTAFTPNNDGKNDLFGAFGNLNTLTDYIIVVYNRLGQVVFKSNDPFKKWDGKIQSSSPQPGTYVWIAKYTNKGVKNIVQKGTITIIY
jgi:gliding motility-associated-like protein